MKASSSSSTELSQDNSKSRQDGIETGVSQQHDSNSNAPLANKNNEGSSAKKSRSYVSLLEKLIKVGIQSLVGGLILLMFILALPIFYVATLCWYSSYSFKRDKVIVGLGNEESDLALDPASIRKSKITSHPIFDGKSHGLTFVDDAKERGENQDGPGKASLQMDSMMEEGHSNKSLKGTETKIMTNYSNTYSLQATVKMIYEENDIVDIVRWARQNHQCIRAAGSLFSWPEIVTPGAKQRGEASQEQQSSASNGVVLDLVHYNKMVKAIKLPQPEGDGTVALVTVQAGMKVWQLCDLLERMGYALPVLGNVTGQSVGGVVSTGTHGKNPRFGTMSSLVQNMRVVLANGKVLNVAMQTYNEPQEGLDTSEIDDSIDIQDMGRAVGVSMGLLGVVSTVTFRVIPKHRLAYSIQAMSFESFLDSYDKLLEENEHVAAIFFPHTDHFRVELSRRLTKEENDLPTRKMPVHGRNKLFFAQCFNWLLFESRFGIWFEPIAWAIQRFIVIYDGVERASPGRPAIDAS